VQENKPETSKTRKLMRIIKEGKGTIKTGIEKGSPKYLSFN
jgi:hypothetical protein